MSRRRRQADRIRTIALTGKALVSSVSRKVR